MHNRSQSLSTISGIESEAGDERRCAWGARADFPLGSRTLESSEWTSTSTSNEHEQYKQIPTCDQPALQHVVDSLAKLKPQNVPHQPPHLQHIPLSLEIAQTSALIVDQEVKMAELNAKLGEMAQDMLLLARQHQAAAQMVRNYRFFIAGKCLSSKCRRAMDSCACVAIRRVPMDVLAEIFLFYLASGPSCSPWTLTAVSRAFRVTAFSTPRLWGRITITIEKYYVRWVHGSEQCNTLPRLQRALSRVAAAPLDIGINLSTYSHTKPEQQKRAIKLLRTLIRTSSRWVSLRIDNLSMHDFDFRCLERDYGLLVSLVMREATPRRLVQAIDRSSPNLTTLTATIVQVENFAALSWWSRLTTLSYEAHSQDNNPEDRIRILNYITRCTGLRELTLSAARLRFTTGEIALSNSRSLPSLRKLYFINVNCPMLFDCPKLTHLSYKTDFSMRSDPATAVIHSTNVHRLERLVYCEVKSPLVGQYLAPLVAPNLQKLRIKSGGWDREGQKLWEKRSEKFSLEILQLEWVCLGVNVLKSALKEMEGLKILKMRNVEIAKTAFKLFALKPKPRKSSILCPDLVILDVHCLSLIKVGDVKPILKEVAESRRIAGTPLTSLIYHSSEGTVDLCQR